MMSASRRRRLVTLSACLSMLFGSTFARADGEIFLRVTYGPGLLKEDRASTWTAPVYQEEASFAADYVVAKGLSFFASAGYMLSNAVGVGIGLDRTSRDLTVDGHVIVPHPIYFDSPREASVSASGGMTETALSLDLFGRWPLGPVELNAWAGPALFLASADFISGMPFTESAYPYDTVSMDVRLEKGRKSAFGLSAGTSLDIRLSRGLALSVTGRYLRATVGFQPSSGIPRQNVALGGFKIGGGLKVAF